MKTIKCFCIAILLLIFIPPNSNAGWKYVTPMPNGRYRHDATLGLDGKIYVMGGWVFKTTRKGNGTDYANGNYSSLVYDRQTDKWEFLEPVPGYLEPGYYSIFDDEKGVWRKAKPVKDKKGYYKGFFPEIDSKNPWQMYHDPIPSEKLRKTNVMRVGWGVAIVTGKDGLIYWLGGTYNLGIAIEDIVLPYDPVKKLWPDSETERIYHFKTSTSSAWTNKTIYKTDIPPMNERRAYHEAVVTSDGKIYVFGGRRTKMKTDSSGQSSYTTKEEVTDTVECYDPQTNKWEYRKPMSIKRYNFAAVVGPDDRIYTFGGSDVTKNSVLRSNGVITTQKIGKIQDVTEIYDPKTDTWTTLKPMPEPRAAMAGVLGADGKIYILGGSREGNKDYPVKSVFIYDPVKNTWKKGPSMNIERTAPAAVATPDGKIYVIGGTDIGLYGTNLAINWWLHTKFYTGKVHDTVEVLDIFEYRKIILTRIFLQLAEGEIIL